MRAKNGIGSWKELKWTFLLKSGEISACLFLRKSGWSYELSLLEKVEVRQHTTRDLRHRDQRPWRLEISSLGNVAELPTSSAPALQKEQIIIAKTVATYERKSVSGRGNIGKKERIPNVDSRVATQAEDSEGTREKIVYLSFA